MPRCLMAKKWKAAPAAELEETDEEIDVVGDGRGRSPAPAATAPGPPPRDPEPTLLYNGDLQATYDQIKAAGKNNVDGVVQWLQDSKVIDKAKGTEEKVRSYLQDANNKAEVTAEKFKETIGKIAREQEKNIDQLSKSLADYGSKLLSAVQAGAQAAATAIKQEMSKK